ncbi:MAG: hypothetical protein HY236_10360 [Acidobacteria bacterium]|nr:hypothetical protein [Acidobacteriota bacterium]
MGVAGGGRLGHGMASGSPAGGGRRGTVSGGISGAPQRGAPQGGWQSGYRRNAGNAPQASGPGIFVYPNTYTPNTYGSVSGFGNVVYPGTGHAPGTFSPFSIVDPTFGTRLTNTVSGFGYPYGYGSGYGYGRGYRPYRGSNTIIIPYAYPVYVPYQEPLPYDQPPPAPPQVIYIVPAGPDRSMTNTAPPPQRDSVVTYVVPPRSEEPPAPAPAPQPLYLIALKNHSIYSATEYWLEDDTLHYITLYGAHNQATLDQVDLEFTTRLNRERGIEFTLRK